MNKSIFRQRFSLAESHPIVIVLMLLITGCLLGGVVSCEEDESQLEVDPQTTNLLTTLKQNVYLPALQDFQQQAQALKAAVDQWSQDPSDANLELAQDAWRTTVDHWQMVELMQVGPAGASTLRVGGQNLRDQIYSFPLINSCRVDQEILNQRFAGNDSISSAPFNVRGLDALERILFLSGTSNTCPMQVKINRDGLWDDFVSDEDALLKARHEYAQVAVDDILTSTGSLVDAWSNSFGDQFQNGAAPFQSQQDALDQVFAGLFYMDKYVKDLKLGNPLSITGEVCEEDLCVELFEHKESGVSRDALIANLEGFLWVFTGVPVDQIEQRGDVFGFDDMLAQEGASGLGDDIIEKTNEAIDLLRQDTRSLQEHAAASPDEMREIHEKIKSVTTILKTEFVTILSIKIPKEGAGDND